MLRHRLNGVVLILVAMAFFFGSRSVVMNPDWALPMWLRVSVIVLLAIGLPTANILTGVAQLLTGKSLERLNVDHRMSVAGIGTIVLTLASLAALFLYRQASGAPSSPPGWQKVHILVGIFTFFAGSAAFVVGLWPRRSSTSPGIANGTPSVPERR